jgi:hypothetical protein
MDSGMKKQSAGTIEILATQITTDVKKEEHVK